MGTRARSAVVDLWKRENGLLSPRRFARRVGGSEALIMRLRKDKNLAKHQGSVNSVSFNSDGTILASASYDRDIILWNWDAGKVKLKFHSGHSDQVFHARFMPFTGDKVMVTCAADGEVRQAMMLEGGKVLTSVLGVHDGEARKLAIEPCSPHIFYSCGTASSVLHFDIRSRTPTELLTNTNFHRSFLDLNAIAIDPADPNFFVVGDTLGHATMYDIRRYKWDGSSDIGQPVDIFYPPHLNLACEVYPVSGLAFSHHGELLTSYVDEKIYLFQKGQGLITGPWLRPQEEEFGYKPEGPMVFEGRQNGQSDQKEVSFLGPNCDYVASGSDCGRLFIWRKSDAKLMRAVPGDSYGVECIESHPCETVIASCGADDDIKIWIPNAPANILM